jgi:hypothetical protein
MSIQDFVERSILENREYVEEVRRLQEILDSLGERQRRPMVYAISITSNT